MIFGSKAAQRIKSIAKHFVFSTSKKYRYKFQSGNHMIPHPAKAHKGGEDAIFVSDNLLVVADGVGGWADHGVDPGKYSKKLCKIIGNKITNNFEQYIDHPDKLLHESWKENKEEGSTTICMLSMNPQTGLIKSYYLGDSVYGIFRDKDVEMAQQQQKSFNFPFQIGSQGDHPSQGVSFQYEASKMELDFELVIATDGVWDNLSVEQIYKIVKKNKSNLKEAASEVAKQAYKLSLNDNYESPFSKKAKEAGYGFKGGKSDDISVIVGRVIQEQL